MDLFEGLDSLAEGEFEIYPVGKAQPHDIGIVFLILERGCPFGELVEVHVKKVDGELPVKITEFIFPVLRGRKPLWKFFEIPFVVRAVVIDALVDTEVLTILDGLERMSAVGALEFERRNDFFSVHKGLSTDLAFKLPATAGVVINIVMRGTAERTDGIRRDCTLLAIVWFDRLYGLAVPETVVLIPKQPVLFYEGLDDGQLIRKEFLIFGAVEFIMSPLSERDISSDKENKPADLAILFLNDVK